MKVYVSEKENINLKFNKRCELVILDSKPVIEMTEQEFNYPIKTSTLLAYSLEQHEAEIRKPLEDEIVKLNEFISRLISEKEPETVRGIIERHHREIMLKRQNKFLEEKVERLKKEK